MLVEKTYGGTKAMKTPNRPKSTTEPEDEDDRKPPAREIRIVNPQEDDNHHTLSNHVHDSDDAVRVEALDSSDDSMPMISSSPVARRRPNNNYSYTYETPSPQQQPSSKLAASARTPALLAATPYSSHYDEDEEDSLLQKSHITSSSWPHQVARYSDVLVWFAAVLLAALVFVVQILPTAALTALVFGTASAGMLGLSVRRAAWQWYQDPGGLGLGVFLPSSLVTLLTQTSVHEFMTEGSFVQDYQHWLLYFMPLPTPQLEASIQRLTPAHRDQLLQPGGVGRLLLGDDTLRLLVGQQQAQQPTTRTNHRALALRGGESATAATVASSSSSTVQSRRQQQQQSERLDLDSDASSDLGLDVTPLDLSGGLSDAQATSVARRLRLADDDDDDDDDQDMATSPNNNNNNNNDDDADAEEIARRELQVLTDAAWDAYTQSVWNPLRDYVSTSLVRPTVSTVGHWTRRAVRWSLLGGSGFGLWCWLGMPLLTTTTGRQSSHSVTRPFSSWGVTVVLGGTTAAAAAMGWSMHQARRRSNDDDNTKDESSNDE